MRVPDFGQENSCQYTDSKDEGQLIGEVGSQAQQLEGMAKG